MLDNARDFSKPHLAKGISAMTSVIEDQPVLGVNGIHEIRAETNGKPENPNEIAWRSIVLNMAGLHGHGAEETQIVRRGHEDECVVTHTGPFHRRLRVVIGEAYPED